MGSCENHSRKALGLGKVRVSSGIITRRHLYGRIHYWFHCMSKTLSTTDVASLMGVAVKSVQNWIDQGKLRAGRTPGGHRRISTKHFISFLQHQNLPIPQELTASTVRLLVIDTNPKLFRSILAKMKTFCPHWEIQVSYHLFTAGQLCESYQPNAILVNLAMADSVAFDLCRKIRKAETTQNSIILGVTPHLDSAIKRKGLQSGATDCIASSIGPRILVGMIEEFLDL